MDHTIPHNDIKLIVLDLDGTLLNSKKELSPGNFAALEAAAAKGIYVVPCTGRFFKAMPECIRSLPFLHYAITINGADIYDAKADKSLYCAPITPERADEVFAALDTLPVIYDCFQDGWGWMDRKFYEISDQFAAADTAPGYIQNTRTPVENFRQVIKARGRGVQVEAHTHHPQREAAPGCEGGGRQGRHAQGGVAQQQGRQHAQHHRAG